MASKDGFRSKSERKRYRKGLIQGHIRNKVEDVKSGARNRAEFYANLRQMKLKRHEIARDFGLLGEMIEDLQRDLRKAADRRTADRATVDEALGAVLKTRANATGVAEDYQRLARKKIFYGEAAA